MRVDYIIRRLAFFLLVVWVAATLNFFLPRLGNRDPIRGRLLQQSAHAGAMQTGLEDMVKEYNKKFGLDRPLLEQYVFYLRDVATLDFSYSITRYPAKVMDIISKAIPWTLGLLSVTTILGFIIGTLFGALLAWGRAPKLLKYLVAPILTLSAVPYYLLGLILLEVFAFQTRWFPLFGGYSINATPQLSLSFMADVVTHSILPAVSIILSAVGFWALGMRGMMVTVEGEDYMTFAEAKGLKASTLFFRYAVRNAVLPQATSLAIAIGYIVSGTVLVEVVFGYPGVGLVLYDAITGTDYTVIQGVVMTIILAISLATTVVDLILPLLDPRISYRRA